MKLGERSLGGKGHWGVLLLMRSSQTARSPRLLNDGVRNGGGHPTSCSMIRQMIRPMQCDACHVSISTRGWDPGGESFFFLARNSHVGGNTGTEPTLDRWWTSTFPTRPRDGLKIESLAFGPVQFPNP